MKNDNELSKVELAAKTLIRNDLKYILTVIKNNKLIMSNYVVFMFPYLGLIIDGTEDWIKAVQNRKKINLSSLLFNDESSEFYCSIRKSIKMWDDTYYDVYKKLECKYKESDNHFKSVCKPIASLLNLYDKFGADKVNGLYCGNTILCAYYYPRFSYRDNDGEYMKKMGIVGGKYISLFGIDKSYNINRNYKFTYQDFGGLVKIPFGNEYNYKFVLFSVLCQINFVLYCINGWIADETTTKLRMAYLLYYYLTGFIQQININNGTTFQIDNKLNSRDFRNAMAHYKLGMVMHDDDLKVDDPMFGLTIKMFGLDYYDTKEFIFKELINLSKSISKYLNIKCDGELLCTD